MIPALLSPVTGAPLRPEGDALLRDADGRRWPVLDGIAYLRTGREALVDAAVAAIDQGDADGAHALLLADQDDWWTGVRAGGDALRTLVRDRDHLSLRDAMGLLAFDRVGDYFAHRWSDPTYLAGLALFDAHWRPAASAFELACGIGHYGRELLRRGLGFTGADVVFSKLWLARHWVAGPEARLVCFDAASPWPLSREAFDLVFCHDAFYFLEPKAAILAELRGRVAEGGRLSLSHIHNGGADNLSAGRAVSTDEMAGFFPDATLYDDAELTRAVVEARPPRPAPLAELGRVEAFSVEDGPARPSGEAMGLVLPPRAVALRLNPLYRRTTGSAAIQWPSPRYEAEYGPRATYPARLTGQDLDGLGLTFAPGIGSAGDRAQDAAPEGPVIRAVAPVSLRTGDDTAPAESLDVNDAVRRRVLVDLPDRW